MARTAEDDHDFERLDLLPADFSRRNTDLQLDDAKKRTGRLDQLGTSKG